MKLVEVKTVENAGLVNRKFVVNSAVRHSEASLWVQMRVPSEEC